MKVRRLSNEPALQKNQVKRKKVHFIFYRCEGKTERNKQKKSNLPLPISFDFND